MTEKHHEKNHEKNMKSEKRGTFWVPIFTFLHPYGKKKFSVARKKDVPKKASVLL